jgi:hypothetical protein
MKRSYSMLAIALKALMLAPTSDTTARMPTNCTADSYPPGKYIGQDWADPLVLTYSDLGRSPASGMHVIALFFFCDLIALTSTVGTDWTYRGPVRETA